MKIGETLPGREERIVNLKPLYLDFDGVRMSQNFTIKNWRQAINYKPRPDDVFIATYPKCGTTWMQEITYLIFNNGSSPTSQLERMKNCPFIDLAGELGPQNMARPGCIKTHLPRNLVPYSDEAKYIIVLRNPKDCVVSYFHHQKYTFSAYEFADGKFEDFFELFIQGKMEYNDYFTHLLSWYPQTKLPNAILIHYEDLKNDPRSEILRLGRFLGEEYYKALLDNGLIDIVIERSTLSYMKKYFRGFEIPIDACQDRAMGLFIQSNLKQKTANDTICCPDFLREGRVGGWKDMLTHSMNARLEKKIYETLQTVCPEIIQKWRDYNILA